MANESIEEKLKQIKINMDKNHQLYDGIGEEIEKECGKHEGPYFAPRNDIERRKVKNEVRGAGESDDE